VIELTVREFEGIVIDTRDWPLILWDSPPLRVPDSASMEALAYLEQLWRSTPLGTRSFMITDLSRVEQASPASQRKQAADFMEKNATLQRKATAGGAIVVASALMRGVITAVFWLRPPPMPSVIVPSREEALLRGLEALEAEMPVLPPNLRSLRDRLTRKSAI
jgi:hypothetical protein